MTVLEELLSKIKYIYVLGTDGKPQMPTKRKRHVLKLLNTGKARIVEKVPFTIQLKYENNPVLQPILLAEDPGRTNIGVAVLELLDTAKVVFTADVETRNKEIPKLMRDRKAHRMASRRGEREVRKRKAKKNGTVLKHGYIDRRLPQCEEDIHCKVIRNTEARFCNRQRPDGWLTPTAEQLVRTHINILHRLQKYLSITDVAIEINKFAFLSIDNPDATGLDFQNGPLKGYGDVKQAIYELQDGTCMMCKNKIEHYHHIIPRHLNGSESLKNRVGLCNRCHKKVHTNPDFAKRLTKKKSGESKKYGALSVLNQAIPYIYQRLVEKMGKEHIFVCDGYETAEMRKIYGYNKTKENQIHEIDAICIGLASTGMILSDCADIKTYKIKQFRRQNRAIINHQTERSYYLNAKKIATNRKPRFEQSGDALSDWYKKQIESYGLEIANKLLSILKVKKSCRSYNTKNRLMPGTVFIYNGQRHILTGQLTGGKYLRAYENTKINYPISKCQIVRNNEGLVFV